MSADSVCILPQQLYIGVIHDAESDSYVITQFDEVTGQDAAITIRAWNMAEFLSSLGAFHKGHEETTSAIVEKFYKAARDA